MSKVSLLWKYWTMVCGTSTTARMAVNVRMLRKYRLKARSRSSPRGSGRRSVEEATGALPGRMTGRSDDIYDDAGLLVSVSPLVFLGGSQPLLEESARRVIRTRAVRLRRRSRSRRHSRTAGGEPALFMSRAVRR